MFVDAVSYGLGADAAQNTSKRLVYMHILCYAPRS